MLPVTVFWANVHGGYIYVFIMLTPVVGIHVLGLLWRKLAVKLELAPANPAIAPLPGTTLPALWHTIAVGFLAFLASIIFNPFHLTNLTHTFQISISENAEGWRNVHEWWPAFRWDNPVGTAFPFLVMTVAGNRAGGDMVDNPVFGAETGKGTGENCRRDISQSNPTRWHMRWVLQGRHW